MGSGNIFVLCSVACAHESIECVILHFAECTNTKCKLQLHQVARSDDDVVSRAAIKRSKRDTHIFEWLPSTARGGQS